MCGGGYGIFRLAAFGEEDFCGGDRLADVALGVVGAVDEQAADGGGQSFAADTAGLIEVGTDLASMRWVASFSTIPSAGPRFTRSVLISSNSPP